MLRDLIMQKMRHDLSPFTYPRDQILATTDMVTTTPTKIVNISPAIDARIESTLQQLNEKYPDSLKYMEAVTTTLAEMKAQGLLDKPIEEVKVSLVNIVKKYFEKLPPQNPLDNPKAFIENTVKYVGWTLVNIYAGNKIALFEKAINAGMQVYDLFAASVTNMTVREFEDYVATQLVEITYAFVIDKTARKVLPRIIDRHKLPESFNPHIDGLSPSSAAKPQEAMHGITPEGHTIESKSFSSQEKNQLHLDGLNIKKDAIKFLDESHIFREAPGHFAKNTLENKKLLLDLVSDSSNFLGYDKRGTKWFGKILPNGKQLWATLRDNMIRNGGINDVIKSFNPETGLSKKI